MVIKSWIFVGVQKRNPLSFNKVIALIHAFLWRVIYMWHVTWSTLECWRVTNDGWFRLHSTKDMKTFCMYEWLILVWYYVVRVTIGNAGCERNVPTAASPSTTGVAPGVSSQLSLDTNLVFPLMFSLKVVYQTYWMWVVRGSRFVIIRPRHYGR